MPILIRLVRVAIAAATVIGALSTERAACWWISASQIASSPQSFGSDDLIERLRERVGVGLLVHLAVEFVIPAEFHGMSRARRAQLKGGRRIWQFGVTLKLRSGDGKELPMRFGLFGSAAARRGSGEFDSAEGFRDFIE